MRQTTVDGITVAQLAVNQGFQVISRDTAFDSLTAPKRLLGTFDEETLEVQWQGSDARVGEPAKLSWLSHISEYFGSVTEPSPMSCEPNLITRTRQGLPR